MTEAFVDDELLKSLSELEKDGSISKKFEPCTFMPTGSLSLDYAIGGGWPRGYSSMVSGKNTYGKTTIALMTAVRVHQNGGKVAVLDTEKRWKLDYARISGMGEPNKEDFFYIRPKYAEAMGELIRSFAEHNFDLIIVDSAASIMTRAEFEATLEDNFMMTRARVLSRICYLTASEIALGKSVVLWTNQYRQSKDYGVTRPGGEALQHQMTIAADLYAPEYEFTEKSKGSNKFNLNPVSMKINGRTYRNDVCQNFREFSIHVRSIPRLMVNKAGELVELGVRFGYFTKEDGSPIRGSCAYCFDGKKIAVGFDKTVEAVMKDADMADAIEKRLRVAIELERSVG